MNRTLTCCYLLLLLVISIPQVQSQTIRGISGTVSDSKSKVALPGVSVLVNDEVKAVTDSLGFYRIAMTVEEPVVLKFLRKDYSIGSLEISRNTIFATSQRIIREGLSAADMQEVNIKLKPEADFTNFTTKTVAVTDSVSNEPISGVSLVTSSNNKRYLSNKSGVVTYNEYQDTYTLTFTKQGYKPITISVSELKQQEFKIALSIQTRSVASDVKSVSRKDEKWMAATTSVEVLTADQIRRSPYINAYSSLAQLRGVQMVQSGLAAQNVNTSGFARTGNNRMLFQVDGVDGQLPDHNYAIGNLTGVSELDIERIEIIPLGASALYGPNAMNGAVNVITKNPFDHTGIDASLKTGFNNISTINGSLSEPLFAFDLWAAHKFNEKFAIKFGYSYLETTDWQPSLQPNNRIRSDGEGLSSTDPGYDGANSFGDEFATLFPLGTNGTDVNVTRTGYDEIHLFDYALASRKLNFSVHYRPFSFVEAMLQFEKNVANTIFTGVNRINLPEQEQTRVKFALQGDNFHLRFSDTEHEVGLSYDAQVLGRNLTLLRKINTFWFLDFGAAFGGALVDQGVPANDVDAARLFADGPGINNLGVRLDPSDPAFETTKEQLINNQLQQFQNLPTTSEFEGFRNLQEFELFYDFEHLLKVVGIQIGYSSKSFSLNRGSIYFQGANNFDYSQTSYFAQIHKTLFDKLKIQGNIRVDGNDFYSDGTSVRGALSYQIGKGHFLRASYNEGFRFPSFYEMFSSRDMGRSTTGGISFLRGSHTNLDFIFFNPTGQGFVQIPGNSLFLADVNEFDARLRRDMERGISKTDAVNNHIGILTNAIVANGDLTRLGPEQRTTIEVGYRGMLSENLTIDLSGYYSETEGLIAPVGVVRPFSVQQPGADINAVVDLARDDRTRQIFYFYQNSRQTIESYGVRLGANYHIGRGYNLNVNGSWDDFQTTQDDRLVSAFNSPPYMANAMLANDNVWRSIGFAISVHWQDSFLWKDNFLEGTVDSFTSVNAQLSYHIDHLGAIVSFGAQNLLNQKYVDNFGGPTVGSLYYLSLSLDDLLQF